MQEINAKITQIISIQTKSHKASISKLYLYQNNPIRTSRQHTKTTRQKKQNSPVTPQKSQIVKKKVKNKNIKTSIKYQKSLQSANTHTSRRPEIQPTNRCLPLPYTYSRESALHRPHVTTRRHMTNAGNRSVTPMSKGGQHDDSMLSQRRRRRREDTAARGASQHTSINATKSK